MSKFTTQVRYICEYYAGRTESADYDEVDEVIEAAMDDIFDEYPIYDESYREILNRKILRHYYTREICAETVGLWKLWLNNKMFEIMPYYNELYKSAMIEYNPLYDVDMTTNKSGVSASEENTSGSSSGQSSGNSEGHSNRGSDSTHRFADTPQGGLNGIINDNYLTNASIDNNSDVSDSRGSTSGSTTGSSSGNRKFEGSDAYFEKVSGYRNGSASKRIKEFRENFLRIDEMIIEELKNLFFGLWD